MPWWELSKEEFKPEEVLGERIAEGHYRVVYKHKTNPKLVIKQIKHKNIRNQHNENRIEYVNWRNLREIKSIAELMVPVVDISTCSDYLSMVKASALGNYSVKSLPKRIPTGFIDGHIKQLSRIKRKIFIHDYGCGILKPRFRPIDPVYFWKKTI